MLNICIPCFEDWIRSETNFLPKCFPVYIYLDHDLAAVRHVFHPALPPPPRPPHAPAPRVVGGHAAGLRVLLLHGHVAHAALGHVVLGTLNTAEIIVTFPWH